MTGPTRPDARRRDAGHDGSTTTGRTPSDLRGAPAGGGDSQEQTVGHLASDALHHGADALLLIFADAVDDLERVRIATENRARALVQVKGMEGTPEQERLAGMIDQISALENQATLDLKRAMRRHPLGPWVKRTIGVGEKQAARLLAAIGDPYWHTVEDRPRTVSQLWAYCGLHVLPAGPTHHDAQPGCASGDPSAADPLSFETRRPNVGGTSDHPGHESNGPHAPSAGVAARRRKGQKANWSTIAKTRAWLIATSCIKQARSPYRKVYDDRRAHTKVTHPDWTDGHSHADGLRIVSKAILRDLWIESRDLRAMPLPATEPDLPAGSSTEHQEAA